ncbi:MAG: hypothetical protein LC800_20685 [Acidobacteria bacterium]|nr:hypothetical protein [Acidobacteriota bacterium]
MDSHWVGCDCGLCNSQGKSYGVAIYVIDDEASEDDIDEGELRELDPLLRVYGLSEQVALENARAECKNRNLTVIGR